MLEIDLWTVTLVTALVIVVAGVTFIADTLVRRDDIAGRIWSIAYLGGMLTVVSYLFWAGDGRAWWAVAVGNAGFVATVGCLWVGTRAYNNRPGFLWVFVLITSLLCAFAVVIAGPGGGDWAGAVLMFVAIAVFTGGAAIESLRGDIGANPNARALVAVQALACIFYSLRTVAFIVSGPDSASFQIWFGSVSTSFVTIVLVIVAAITMSVLRADKARLRGRRRSAAFGDGPTISIPALERITAEWMGSGIRRGGRVAVLSVRFDGLAAVTTAFGRSAADDLCAAWTFAVRANSPAFAVIAEREPGWLLILTPAASPEDARRAADAIVDGLLVAGVPDIGGIRPTATVGIALSEPIATPPREVESGGAFPAASDADVVQTADAVTLIARADAAAHAAAEEGASVLPAVPQRPESL